MDVFRDADSNAVTLIFVAALCGEMQAFENGAFVESWWWSNIRRCLART